MQTTYFTNEFIFKRAIGVSAAIVLAGMACAAQAAGNNPTKAAELTAFSSAPLCFEARTGQPDGSEGFIARGVDCSVLLAPDEANIILGRTKDEGLPHQSKSARAVRLQLVGANPKARMTGLDRMEATANYFIGSDPSKWQSGVPLFARVQASDVYPGVQLVYYANQSAQLEYDFLLQPAAHLEQIRFRVQGADEVRVDDAGNLVLKIDGQEICQHQPSVYQETGGTRTQIAASYHLNQDGTVGFALGGYDRGLPLVIDPVLDFLTYVGGKNLTIGWSVALQGSNIYVAGETLSKNLPTNNPILFTNSAGIATNFERFQGGTAGFGDAFIASYTTNGAPNYFSYLGGRRADGALAIAAAPDGSIWLTGFTDSTDFPITNGILSTNTIKGVLDTNDLYSSLTGPRNNAPGIPPADAFLVHVSAGGTNLLFSTYYGGEGIDEGTGIVLDNSSDVFITGLTSSTNLPGVTANSFQPTNNGSFDAFVAEFSPTGSADPASGYTNTYATFLGGTNLDYGLSIALDSKGDAWVAGVTFSTNFPTANNDVLSNQFSLTLPNQVYKTNHLFADLNSQTNSAHHNTEFHSDAFVSEISPMGTQVPFSTFLGGSNDDVAVHLTIDSSDNVYVTGYTLSLDFPTNVVTTLNFSTSLTNEFPGFTSLTNAFVGATTNFISHAFVTELSQLVTNMIVTNESSMVTNSFTNYVINASTTLGGDAADRATSIALDMNGNVFVIGSAGSTNFFVTNAVIVTNNYFADTNLLTSTNVNRRGVITNYNNLGIVTNNFTFTNMTSTNFTQRFRRSGSNTNDVFIAVLSPGLTNYLRSIILGGPGDNEPNGIAVDPSGDVVYFVGDTTSRTNFTTTTNAGPFTTAQPIYTPGGRPEGFVGRISGILPFP